MDNKITFEIEEMNILEEMSNDQLAIVEVYVCHDGNNLHNLPISLDTLKRAKKTLKNKFLVAGFNGKDFEGHEIDEQIIGFFPESSKMDFRKKNNRTYLVAQAVMSKIYAKWAYDIFMKNNHKSVSMEITVVKSSEDKYGLTHIDDFIFNGVTVLGAEHMPACEGSDAQIISFSKESAAKAYKEHLSAKNIKKKYVEDVLAKKFSEEGEEVDKNNIPVESDDTTYMENHIKINNNKEAAIDSSSWANPGEKLYNPILESSNKESLIKEAYLIVDEGYEEAPSEKLKYPHHQINEDELVLNIKGVIAAFQRASQEGIVNGEVKEHLLRHYRELGLSTENFENLEEGGKSMPEEMEDKATREEIEKDDEKEALKEQKEDEKSDRDDAKEEAYECNNEENSEAENTEKMESHPEEDEENDEDDEDDEKEVEMEALRKENAELKEQLCKYEAADKVRAVESVLAGVADVFSADEISALREESEKYSLSEINIFENGVKARAFENMKKATDKVAFTKMAITDMAETKPNGLW